MLCCALPEKGGKVKVYEIARDGRGGRFNPFHLLLCFGRATPGDEMPPVSIDCFCTAAAARRGCLSKPEGEPCRRGVRLFPEICDNDFWFVGEGVLQLMGMGVYALVGQYQDSFSSARLIAGSMFPTYRNTWYQTVKATAKGPTAELTECRPTWQFSWYTAWLVDVSPITSPNQIDQRAAFFFSLIRLTTIALPA